MNTTTSQFDGNPSSMRKVGAVVSYEIVRSWKSTGNLLFCREEQQFYRRCHEYKKSQTYICREVGCKCRVHIRNDECLIGNGVAHNHDNKMGMYYDLSALNEIKRILDSKKNKLWPKQVFDDVVER